MSGQDLEAKSSSLCDRIAQSCGYVVFFLGLCDLITWVSLPFPAIQLHVNRLLMSPNTAMAFILAGMVLVCRIRYRTCLYAEIFSKVAALLISLLGLFSLVQFLARVDLGIDHWLFRSLQYQFLIDLMRMSPITAANLLLAGCALLLMSSNLSDMKRAEGIAAAFSTLVVLVGAVTILGYIYENYPSYASQSSKVGLTTTIAFLILGLGLIASVGPEAWPLRPITGTSIRARMLRSFLPVTVATVILNDLLEAFLRRGPYMNPALVSVLMALLFLLIVSVIVSQISRVIGHTIEQIESDRKRAQESLQLTEQKYRSIVENAVEGIYQTTPEGRFITANAALARMHGYDSPEELIATITDIEHQVYVDSETRKEYQRQLEEKGWVRNFEYQIYARDGQIKWFSKNARAVRDEKGTVLYYEGTVEDITERKQSQVDHETILRTALDGFWMTDLQGHFLEINDAYCQLIGYTCKELQTMRIQDIEAVETPAKVAQHIKTVIKMGNDRFETQHLRKDATLIDFEVSMNYSEVAGGRLFVFLRDRTDQKRVDAEVRRLNEELERRVMERTAQLKATNEELEAFTFSASHDLRTPLRAINGFSRILLEEYTSDLGPESQRYLRLIRDNTDQMSELIDDLLALSHLGRRPLTKTKVSSAKLVQDVLESLQAEYSGRFVDVHVGPLPDSLADPILLKEVWANLLSNAFKFTSSRPVASINIGFQEKHGERIYHVKDNGIGFDMRYLHKLFGVFQRLHRSQDYPGTGVGLAIVRRIIQRHGGRVWGEAQLEKGAAFYFTLGDGE